MLSNDLVKYILQLLIDTAPPRRNGPQGVRRKIKVSIGQWTQS